MKDFLSDFMQIHQAREQVLSRPVQKKLAKFRTEFVNTTDKVLASLGKKPFHLTSGLNAAVFDSVFVAFARKETAVPKIVGRRYERLKKDREFRKRTSSHTTDVDAVGDRLRIARKLLFG
jgi:hypothetical protein